MSILDAIILGIVQGLTEFLPISSSGHLILAEYFLKLNVQDLLSFDVAVHFGTLLAIFVYFAKDYVQMLNTCWDWLVHLLAHRKHSEEMQATKDSRKFIQYLIVATIPAVIIGALFSDYIEEHFRQPFTVAILLIAVGVFFFFAEYIASKVKHVELNQTNTFVIGVAQTLALFSGVSRSGATISAGIIQGIKREEAARFSFLLGSVAISAAIILSIYKVMKGTLVLPPFEILATGIITSFVSGYVAISFLLKFLKKHTLHVFGLYRVIFGFLVLYLLK